MSKKAVIIIILLAIPAFSLMLRLGVYTMHDFHLFRQFEFDKCIQDLVFPCRWAADAGLGYGEPLFNFYGQFPYWLGEIIHLIGFSITNSVKLLFILSIILSGVSMYAVSRRFWGDFGGMISAVLYMYAPYRAVDVWVRGALNESLAFVFYPLIFYALDQYSQFRKPRDLWILVVTAVMLVTTHNLSVVMFLPFLGLWWLLRLIRQKNIHSVGKLVLAGLLVLGLSAYYLTPVIFESSLVTLAKTTQGYYDYRAHFATLSQLFISRFWGYGASLWGPVDDLSFSLGQVNWMVVFVLGLVVVFKRNWVKEKWDFYALAALALGAIFMTHNKSEFIWHALPFLAYVQFPWRFVGVGLFFLSIASGAAGQVLPVGWRRLGVIIVGVLAIWTNVSYFRPDIWRTVTDAQQFSGKLWDEQRSSALQDFWPASAPQQPTAFAPTSAQFIDGTGFVKNSQKGAQSASYQLGVVSPLASTQFPIVYFPGWKATEGGKNIAISPAGNLGLITTNLTAGNHTIKLIFTNTWPRTVGNLISGLSLGILIVWFLKMRGWRSS